MENTTKNLFETLAETQKQVVENMSNATQNMAKSFISNDLNSDFFKKWYDSQMSFFNQNGKFDETNPAGQFSSWMNNQMNMGNDYLSNMQNNLTQMMNNAGVKPEYSTLYTNWLNSMNTTMQQMMKNMNSTGDIKNAMGGMFNNAESMMKMYELWMPFSKMINDKTFTPEAFKSMVNPAMFKEIMDKMMTNQPEFVKNMMDTAAVREQFFKFVEFNKSTGDQFRNSLNSFMPSNNNLFGNASEAYNNALNSMNQAAAPMMKMMGNSAMGNNMTAVNEIANEFNQFMMKNAEVQYATYQSGNTALNNFAETIYAKMKNGEDLSDFTTVYSEWLNTNDKHLTQLFSTAEYSKLQAELNTFGMKLKQHMNVQMEKSMKDIPVVPRSEMDELYKTVYELRKRVNMLEKQIDTDTEVVAEASEAKQEAKVAAKKTAKNA